MNNLNNLFVVCENVVFMMICMTFKWNRPQIFMWIISNDLQMKVWVVKITFEVGSCRSIPSHVHDLHIVFTML